MTSIIHVSLLLGEYESNNNLNNQETLTWIVWSKNCVIILYFINVYINQLERNTAETGYKKYLGSRKIFSLCPKFEIDDKNQIWGKIAGKISEMHGNIRTRDDISKKWHNTLSKYNPRIADKLASARKTGGGEVEACLDHLEEKISSIKGRGF